MQIAVGRAHFPDEQCWLYGVTGEGTTYFYSKGAVGEEEAPQALFQ